MGFVFRSSFESQAILNFKRHTECHRLARKQHARSSLMDSHNDGIHCLDLRVHSAHMKAVVYGHVGAIHLQREVDRH